MDVTADNYYLRTFGNFVEIPTSDIEKKFEIIAELFGNRQKSASGSEYVIDEDGVYRKSDHWGQVAKCVWPIMSRDGEILENYGNVKIGYARFDEMHIIGWSTMPQLVIASKPKKKKVDPVSNIEVRFATEQAIKLKFPNKKPVQYLFSYNCSLCQYMNPDSINPGLSGKLRYGTCNKTGSMMSFIAECHQPHTKHCFQLADMKHFTKLSKKLSQLNES